MMEPGRTSRALSGMLGPLLTILVALSKRSSFSPERLDRSDLVYKILKEATQATAIARDLLDQLCIEAERDEIECESVPTVISSPLHSRSQVRSRRGPSVVRTIRMIETLMMNIIKQKMPVSASFFRNSTDAFQRRFVDTRITGTSSGFATCMRMHRIRDTY